MINSSFILLVNILLNPSILSILFESKFISFKDIIFLFSKKLILFKLVLFIYIFLQELNVGISFNLL